MCGKNKAVDTRKTEEWLAMVGAVNREPIEPPSEEFEQRCAEAGLIAWAISLSMGHFKGKEIHSGNLASLKMEVESGLIDKMVDE